MELKKRLLPFNLVSTSSMLSFCGALLVLMVPDGGQSLKSAPLEMNVREKAAQADLQPPPQKPLAIPNPHIETLQHNLKTLGFDIGVKEPDGFENSRFTQALSYYIALKGLKPNMPLSAIAQDVENSVESAQRHIHIFKGIRADVDDNLTIPVMFAIENASKRMNVPLSILMEKAEKESAFNPEADGVGSSAQGLYQVVTSTGETLMSRLGDDGLGLSEARLSLLKQGYGRGRVFHAMLNDPKISALMGAALVRENMVLLKPYAPQGKITGVELYMGHFLGGNEAKRFLQLVQDEPDSLAADHFPNQASVEGNRHVFYNRRTGEARTIAEIYDKWKADFGEDNPYEMRLASVQHHAAKSSRRPS